ncbi:Hypothetical Protein FCC1311_102062 [Hondaea fermentalgiana]|uniref:G protein gamma domain-containing protein n=1 Tax=Hondaea fermentalgiana TaxID=2315210 RepID=A0A2R5GZ06_9STRA|nr:Hypothetical Protein FCC1311_102062 [Hondaea fermentalgiana]|eukprot:GBG33983.1 Hypothetical Protein FCC1311_102062 [Hondaea fermentalgiana]
MPMGRDLKSLNEELHALEAELKLIENAQTTSERCEEIAKYVRENEGYDALVSKTPNNPFTQARKTGGGGCCG